MSETETTKPEVAKEVAAEGGDMKMKKPKYKKLAGMYGNPNKITRGDIITAAKKKNGTSKKSKKS